MQLFLYKFDPFKGFLQNSCRLTRLGLINLCNRVKPIYVFCKMDFPQTLTKCFTNRTDFPCTTLFLQITPNVPNVLTKYFCKSLENFMLWKYDIERLVNYRSFLTIFPHPVLDFSFNVKCEIISSIQILYYPLLLLWTQNTMTKLNE